jgi:hypothetical protein
MQVLVFNSYFYPTLEKMKKLRHVVLHGVCDNQVRYNASHSFSDNWGGGTHGAGLRQPGEAHGSVCNNQARQTVWICGNRLSHMVSVGNSQA